MTQQPSDRRQRKAKRAAALRKALGLSRPSAASKTPPAASSPPAATGPVDALGYENTLPPLQEGFTIRSVIGAFFVGLVMLPGSIYLGLTIGMDIGSAIEWVTVILFLELARRSFQTLSRQEIYVLLHVTAGLGTHIGGHALAGGVFASLIWHQYLKTSDSAAKFNLPDNLPVWVAPLDPSVILQRDLLSSVWLPAMLVAVAGSILAKIAQLSISYFLYRLTVDVERLPFPMARVGAEGATALAEESSKEQGSWRWPVFATGAMIGVGFSIVYSAIPIITGAILPKPLQIIPIPFWDATPLVESTLPGAVIGLAFDLGLIMIGFVLPWRVVVGTAIGTVAGQVILNPVLQSQGLLPQWQPGRNALFTQFHNSLDFWLSVSIGMAVFVVIIGLWGVGRTLFFKTDGVSLKSLTRPPPGRGDIRLRWPVLGFLTSSIGYVILCDYLVNFHWGTLERKVSEETFSSWWFVAFAFLYTPLMSYMSARMTGITGRGQPFPFVREGSFFLSGYKKPDIWFAPIPLHDFGRGAQGWRETALTGTPVKSLLKAELLMFPIMLVCSIMFWSYIWSLGAIPSPLFPYAQLYWPLHAETQALWATAQSEGTTYLIDAVKLDLITGAAAVSALLFALLSGVGISTGYFYGLIQGVVVLPHTNLVIFAGAIIGRYYFARRFGEQTWRRYTPVLLAGYFCGAGLVGMLAIAVVFFKKAVHTLPY